MSNPQTWLGLSVQEFLGQVNWDGRTPQRQTAQSSAPVKVMGGALESWGSLTVQAFFKANNWMGVPLDLESFSSTEDQFVPTYTTAVRDFFKYLPWDGQPAIASLPKLNPQPSRLSQAHPNDDLTLVDLSDLF
jgi:hypothetical protein